MSEQMHATRPYGWVVTEAIEQLGILYITLQQKGEDGQDDGLLLYNIPSNHLVAKRFIHWHETQEQLILSNDFSLKSANEELGGQ